MKPVDLFKYLEGSWDINRTISSYGFLRGAAELYPVKSFEIDNTTMPYSLMYSESLALESSGEKWGRKYIYTYEDENITKYFSDGTFFYTLEFSMYTPSIITGHHICGCDEYNAKYTIKDENRFSLEYRVQGPNKAYYIITDFVRA